MKKLVMLSIILMTITFGCIGRSTDKVQTNAGLSNDIADSSWCSPDTFPSNGSEGFTLKGITEYNGSEVCEAEWKYDSGVATEYFTRDGSSTMVYKELSNLSSSNGSEEIPSTVDENVTNNSNESLINDSVDNSEIVNDSVYNSSDGVVDNSS